MTLQVEISPSAAEATAASSNPLLVQSSLPYQFPPFDRIKNEHFAPALESGMAEALKEVIEIASRPESPSFENTVVALERSGQLLARVHRVFSNLAGAHTNPDIQKTEKEMAPKLAAHRDAILLNPRLFARIQALHEKRDDLGLDPESKRLLERYYLDFVRAGAKLSEADKEKLRAFNTELATLSTAFSQSVLKEVNASSILVDDASALKGLSEDALKAAAAAAQADGHDGKFVLRLQNTTGQPSLTSLENRATRQKLFEASIARGNRGGEFDSRTSVARMARLRSERAALLGYENHAAYQLEEQTAKTVAAVNKLLAELAPPAVANARREAADMQALIDREGGNFQLAPWDWAFYSEKVRRQRYAFDESELRPYFEISRVLKDGVFYAAGKLYGLSFRERNDLPIYQEDVRIFEVSDADGQPLALLIADFYARSSKRGGAWMNAYVPQAGLFGTKPVVANHQNVPKPPAGQPTLLTWDEVRTMFHEFGHALHGMFSAVRYPRFSGTTVPRDFVEYPSQVNEMWASWPEVLKNYARHHQTGEPISTKLFEKVLAAEKFNQGFATTEYLAASLLDQAWHQLKPNEVPAAVVEFEAAALKKAGVAFAPVPPRYRSTYFSHAFSGGYSAGYYSYIWSEVLDADSVEWFKQNGGLTRANGDHFRRTLLSRGGSQEAMTMFRNFRGANPDIRPLLKRRGLEAVPTAKADL
jgi:peptidyl-dipeptidase Dcp